MGGFCLCGTVCLTGVGEPTLVLLLSAPPALQHCGGVVFKFAELTEVEAALGQIILETDQLRRLPGGLASISGLQVPGVRFECDFSRDVA